jgi:uncharacterized protein
MARDGGDRTRYWPAIEAKYGQPISHWFSVMDTLGDRKYAEQMAYLQAECGFTRAHANALVMYSRGSASSRRFATLDDYLAEVDPAAQVTVRAIVDVVLRARPDLELVIAWNQPMAKGPDGYVFGLSVSTKHILIAPWGEGVLQALRPRLVDEGYRVAAKTVRVPLDWAVDEGLLREMLG